MGFTDLNEGGKGSTLSGSVGTESYTGGKSAFGEFLTAPLVPVVQLDGIYGLDADLSFEYETFTALGGTANTTEENLFTVTTSDTQFSYGVLRSKRFLRYRPGQGSIGRLTAMFSTPVAGTQQRAGLFNQESAFQVGYNGEEFGVLHSYDARAYIASIEVTAAPTSLGTITITPPGILGATDTPVVVTLSASGDTKITAREIAEHSFAGWIVQAVDNKVCFLAESTGVRDNDFTYVVNTATGFVATVNEDRQGAFPVDNWIPQDDWNLDKLNGTGGVDNPSGVTLDPTKLNVFQIRYKWLGAGAVSFSIENPLTGDVLEFHRILWSNQNTQTSVLTPSFKIGYVAYNLDGGADTAVTVKGASMMMAVEGMAQVNHLPRSRSVSKSSLAANQIHTLMSFRNPIVVDGKINTRNVFLEAASIAPQTQTAGQASPLEFFVFVEPVSDTADHIYQSSPGTQVQISYEDGLIDLAQDTAIFTLAVADKTSQNISFSDNVHAPIMLPPNTIVTIAVRSIGSTIANVKAAMNWLID